MEFEVSSLKTQKGRTKIEQGVVQRLILKHFEHFLLGYDANEPYEEDDQYYVEDKLTDELLRESHAHYAYSHIKNAGMHFYFFINKIIQLHKICVLLHLFYLIFITSHTHK